MPVTTAARPAPWAQLIALAKSQQIWLINLAIVLGLFLVDRTQALESLAFTGRALGGTAPFLLLSILIAAWASATGADNLIARAFSGSPMAMIGLAAMAGAFSPFCSCGVIPLIAALLAMNVPLSAVMAFWLASPIMDPSMFVLTTGVIGLEFAVAKTLAALGLGAAGGLVVHAMVSAGGLRDPLREGIGNGGCGGRRVRDPQPVVWRFWTDAERRGRFFREGRKITLFLARWLTLAFLLESLMLAWIPAHTVTSVLGGSGVGPTALATLVGVPAYLNGYAALPLVGGLLQQGMAPGAGLAFLVAGGVTSLPAALAVWALVRLPVFLLYLALSLGGAFTIGILYSLWATF